MTLIDHRGAAAEVSNNAPGQVRSKSALAENASGFLPIDVLAAHLDAAGLDPSDLEILDLEVHVGDTPEEKLSRARFGLTWAPRSMAGEMPMREARLAEGDETALRGLGEGPDSRHNGKGAWIARGPMKVLELLGGAPNHRARVACLALAAIATRLKGRRWSKEGDRDEVRLGPLLEDCLAYPALRDAWDGWSGRAGPGLPGMDLPDRTRTPEIARRHLATSPLDMVAADILAALLNRRPARLSAVRAAPAGARARKIAALRLGLRQDRARADAACADVVAGYRDYIEALQAKAEKTRNALVAHLDIGHPPAQAWKGIAIEALIALAEARPLTHLAAHWGISEAAIRKKLKANGWTARGAGVRKPCPPQRQR